MRSELIVRLNVSLSSCAPKTSDQSSSGMPRQARLQFVSLRSSLVNLPVSLFGPLLERNIASLFSPSPPYANQTVSYQRPQQVAVFLTATVPSPGPDGRKPCAYVGWTGMVSASSLARFNSSSSDHSLETVEIDPQYAESLGFKKEDVVSTCFFSFPLLLTPSRWRLACSMTYP